MNSMQIIQQPVKPRERERVVKLGVAADYLFLSSLMTSFIERFPHNDEQWL